jgi:UDP-2,4-diacetamido-2,4,6-trideoxy-beta-L-altropyranose hydrolase
MNILIRADASVPLGTGHVMRCLALADQLVKKSASIHFACREEKGNLADLIQAKGYGLSVLPAGIGLEADREWVLRLLRARSHPIVWVVVDHYGLDASWESPLRSAAGRLMVIDDLADRPHDCDLLLDQNLYMNLEARYRCLVPPGCRTLLGPRYALLRPEFVEARRSLRKRDGRLTRILISFGGSDPTNGTIKSLEAMRLLDSLCLHIDLVIGAAHPRRDEVRRLCAGMKGVDIHENTRNMARLIAAADLALGAGGTSTWERCFLGLPSFTVVVAENHAEITEAVAHRGATRNLGWHAMVSASHIADAVKWASQHPDEMMTMGAQALAIMGDSPIGDREAVARALMEDVHAG